MNHPSKTHTATKSITFSEHTLHTAGFAHKLKNRDKIKTVRITPVDSKKAPVRPYRNVAISHIKNLRVKEDASDLPTPIQNQKLFSRFSFLHDNELKHALHPKQPLKNVQLEMGISNQGISNRVSTIGLDATNPYKSESLLRLQQLLPINIRREYNLARIHNQQLTLPIYLTKSKGLFETLSPDIQDLLTTITNPPNQSTPQQPTTDPHPKQQAALDFSNFNFKTPNIMALDVGARYIGVAITNTEWTQGIPLGVIELYHQDMSAIDPKQQQTSLIQKIQPTIKVDPIDIAHQLNNLRKKYNVVTTCIGLPQQLGYDQQIVHKIKAFTTNMVNLHGLGNGMFEVCYIDEHHTTLEARKRILKQQDEDEENAMRLEQHSMVGHGGNRVKALKSKSKQYDNEYQKKKGIDSEAAAIILDRFIEIIQQYGEKYSPKVQERFEQTFGPKSFHTM